MREESGPVAVGVVLAAGMGTRVGADGNKAYLQLAGRSMVSWSVDAVTRCAGIARTVVVFRRGEHDMAQRTLHDELPSVAIEYVEGGDTRHGSELNVLRHLSTDIESGVVDVVLIHDAARPLAGPDLMDTALATARRFGGAVPVLPTVDVVTATRDGSLSPVDGTLVRVQTPQAFRAQPLLTAYTAASDGNFDGTDTAACVQQFTDVDVRTFPGSATNLKVTFAHDVLIAGRLLRERISRDGRR